MKKQIIILMLLTATIFTGCYDLDRAPFDKPSSSTFWKTEDQCKQGVMGIYAGLKGGDLYGKMFLIDINSDVAAGYDNYEVLQLGTATPRTGFLNGKWQNGYNVIWRANVALQNLPKAEIDPVKRDQMIGETKFLRACVYFHLLDYFGPLPIYDETINLETELDKLTKPRSTIEDVRKFILKDLSDALAANLPEAWDKDNYGRVTKGAVYALRGKVNLYDKKFKEAIADFEEILKPAYGYKLNDSYANLFTPTGHASKEAIFSIINLGGIGFDYGMPLCFFAGTRASYGSCWNNTVPSTTLADMYENTDGTPFDWDKVIPGYTNKDNKVKERVWHVTIDKDLKKILKEPAEADIIRDMYTKRDPRMMATVIAPYTDYLGWESNAPKMMKLVFAKDEAGKIKVLGPKNGFVHNNKGGWQTYFWRKFVPEGDWNGAITNRAHTPVNFPIIRLADVYLLLAEAYNEVGRSTDAVDYINKVRARVSVNMPAINSGPAWLAATTKDQIFQRIFHERAVELAGEGIRDSDLRRWRISDKILNREELGVTGKRMFTRKFNPERDYLWPIPATEIEMNDALAPNNPGW
ncbi:MAG: RagB/SusD family nutrient uptake outer membrane protein [Rikenellaceae bacterium]